MRALLVSTYELGRQPFGLASPAAWLRDAGCHVDCVDLSRTKLEEAVVRAADLVAFYLPMHTATRLAIPVIRRVREQQPAAHLCAYGLYAPLNATLLGELGIATILGGEFEADLVALVRRLQGAETAGVAGTPAGAGLPRLAFRVPDRRDLPELGRYATLQTGETGRRVVGYTEASRGCRHLCRHCPVVPVYQGRFRLVPREVVLADIAQQVAAGAQHVTFGDPDFFNGIGHAVPLVQALAREFPGLTYDVTIKVEHLLKHAGHLATLRDTGCLFVTTAVESLDDRLLALLEKGHTRADVERVVRLCRNTGLGLSPTFVPFTPWTSLDGYLDLLDSLAALELVEQVAPIQLAIRLLVPEGSRLVEVEEVRTLLGPFDPATLAYPWRHPDARVDALQARVSTLVGVRAAASRSQTFEAVRAEAWGMAGRQGAPRTRPAARPRAAIPYLNEPWYC